MISDKRTRKMSDIKHQIRFCRECLCILQDDLETDVAEQDKDPFDKFSQIRNHTRHANNVIYLRRQLLKLEKMLRDG